MKNLLHLFYQPYKWLVFVPYLAISTLFFGLVAVITATFINKRTAGFLGGAVWARLIGIMTPIKVEIRGKENINKRQSYVIVANHQSYYDVVALYGWLGADIRWVMKKELRKVPGLGIGSKKVGHIFLDRSDTKAGIASMNAAKEEIAHGTSMVIFPEGTRSKNGKPGKFKKGAFKLAIDLGLPILPVTISGTKEILPSHSFDLFPGKVQMVIHEPIITRGYDDSNLQELINEAKEAITGSPEKEKVCAIPSLAD